MKFTITKTVFWAVAFSYISAFYQAYAEPFDESNGSIFYCLTNPIGKKIEPIDGMLTDDYIIALSQKSNFNVIADVTHISDQETVQPYPASITSRRWKTWPNQNSFRSVLADFEGEKQISELRYDEKTYLLWNKPNAMETARLIVAEGKHIPAETLPTEFDLYRTLDAYAKGPLQWQKVPNATAADLPFHAIRFGDMPPELRSQITALSHYEILRPDLHDELFLTDDFWKTAHIQLLSSQRQEWNGKAWGLPHQFFDLLVGGQDKEGNLLPLSLPSLRRSYFSVGNESSSVYDRPGVKRERAIFANEFPETPPTLAPALPLAAEAVTLQGATAFPTGLSTTELEAEDLLQSKISLDVRRRSLTEVLSSMAKKTGLTLTVNPDFPASTTLLTMGIHDMRVGVWMGAIARVYGLYWTKETEKQYVLHAGQQNALKTAMLRLGRGGSPFTPYSAWTMSDEQEQEYQDLVDQIGTELENQGIKEHQAVAFNTISEDLQLQLKNIIQDSASNTLVSRYRVVSKLITDDTVMRLSHTPNYSGIKQRPEWQVRVVMPRPKGEEEFVESLFVPTTVFAQPLPRSLQDQAEIPLPQE